jgi:hypothetical protein
LHCFREKRVKISALRADNPCILLVALSEEVCDAAETLCFLFCVCVCLCSHVVSHSDAVGASAAAALVCRRRLFQFLSRRSLLRGSEYAIGRFEEDDAAP